VFRDRRWRLNLPDRSDFAFAGLWDHWERAGQVIESCTIIVCDAAETIRHVHDKMPVILKPADYDFWLNGGVAERRPSKALLVPYAGQLTVEVLPSKPLALNFVERPRHLPFLAVNSFATLT
jgi:putative SOS response-associated peptidase YedK